MVLSEHFEEAKNSINELEDIISLSYDGIDMMGPEVGQDIGAPDSIQEPMIEGSELFQDAVYSVPSPRDIEAGHREMDLDNYQDLTSDLENALQCYEEAVNSHLDNTTAEEVVDLDIIIQEGIAEEGIIEEQDVYDMAGVIETRRESLENGQRKVRQRFNDDEDPVEKITEQGYNLENIVETRYERALTSIKNNIDQGLSEYAELMDEQVEQTTLDYQPEVKI